MQVRALLVLSGECAAAHSFRYFLRVHISQVSQCSKMYHRYHSITVYMCVLLFLFLFLFRQTKERVKRQRRNGEQCRLLLRQCTHSGTD